MSLWKTLAAAGIALALSCGSAALGQSTEDLSWFRQQWKEAASWEIPDNTYVEYTIETFYEVSKAEVQQLAQEIEGHPQHPRRQEYARKLLLLESGGVVREDVRGWWTDQGWRISRDTREGSDSGFRDTVVTGRTAWRRTPDAMVLADPTGSDERYDHWREGVALRRSVVGFVVGGLGYESSTPIKYEPISAERSVAGEWSARIATETGSRVKELRGTVDGSFLVVESVDVVTTDGTGVIADQHRRFLAWSYDEYFMRPVAHVIETSDSMGRLRSRMTLRSAQHIDTSMPFEVVAGVPDEEHPDPVRSAPKPRVITDARPWAKTVTIRNGGAVETQPLPGSTPPNSRRMLKYIGWIAVVGVLCAAVWWRLRAAR